MAPKGPRMSTVQEEMLLDFLEQHSFLARASTKLSQSLTAARRRALWDEITEALNRAGPAVKTAEHWRQSWRQICCRKRAELAHLRAGQGGTGGGQLPGSGGRVMHLLGLASAEGVGEDFFLIVRPQPQPPAGAVAAPPPVPPPSPPAAAPSPPLPPPPPAPLAAAAPSSVQLAAMSDDSSGVDSVLLGELLGEELSSVVEPGSSTCTSGSPNRRHD
ncbi:hypothetical protein V5799_003309, partial [Amblyomma americanum]